MPSQLTAQDRDFLKTAQQYHEARINHRASWKMWLKYRRMTVGIWMKKRFLRFLKESRRQFLAR